MPDHATVLAALDTVIDPKSGQGLVAAGLVQGLVVAEDRAGFALEVAASDAALYAPVRDAAEAALKALPGMVKVATRTDLARRWYDLMDMNAGRIAEGEITIEEAGWELFRLLLDVASGRKTWAEQWKLHNALVLFNPAPIT